MSIIKVANVHFETTGTNRIDYNTAGYTQIIAGGSGGIIINVAGTDKINVGSNTVITGNLILNNKNVDYQLAFSNTAISSAYDKANSANVVATSALPNTSGITFAGNMTITGNLTALSYNTSSDERLKNIINTAPLGIISLTPQKYEMKNTPGKIRYGFVAQDVLKVFPDLVDNENGYLTLNYIDMIALIIQEMKSMKETIQKLERKLEQNG